MTSWPAILPLRFSSSRARNNAVESAPPETATLIGSSLVGRRSFRQSASRLRAKLEIFAFGEAARRLQTLMPRLGGGSEIESNALAKLTLRKNERGNRLIVTAL